MVEEDIGPQSEQGSGMMELPQNKGFAERVDKGPSVRVYIRRAFVFWDRPPREMENLP